MQALGAMRRLVGVLRTDGDAAGGPPSPTPMLSDLDELVHRFGDTEAVGEVDLADLDDPDRPDPEVQAAAYRVVQRRSPTSPGTPSAPHGPGSG